MEQTEFENGAKKIRQKALRIARSYTSNNDEAEDIAQEVMLKLWSMHKNIECCEHAERLASRISRNLSIDSQRRSHTIALPTGRDIIDEKLTSPQNAVENKENKMWLNKRLASLPETEFQILKLRQVEHKSNDEIANLLGIEKTSVVTLLSRARKKLLNEIRTRIR